MLQVQQPQIERDIQVLTKIGLPGITLIVVVVLGYFVVRAVKRALRDK